MADAHAKPHHDYHLVNPSPWPIIGAVFAFLTAVGLIMWMKEMTIGGLKLGRDHQELRDHGERIDEKENGAERQQRKAHNRRLAQLVQRRRRWISEQHT